MFIRSTSGAGLGTIRTPPRWNFSYADQLIDNITQVDPQAALILNVGVWPGPGWKPPVAPTNADYILYRDGSQVIDTYHMSMASDIFFNGSLTSLPLLFKYYESRVAMVELARL
jgi:hypothetical protein